MSEDPIGLEGGINVYTYAGDDPVNRRDPTGLFCSDGYEPFIIYDDVYEVFSNGGIEYLGREIVSVTCVASSRGGASNQISCRGGGPDGGVMMPALGTVTSGYLDTDRPAKAVQNPHFGLDIALPWGTQVVAPHSGRVVYSHSYERSGRWMYIKNGPYRSRLGHLAATADLSQNAWVERGQLVAFSGGLWFTDTGPGAFHLHWELQLRGTPINPAACVEP